MKFAQLEISEQTFDSQLLSLQAYGSILIKTNQYNCIPRNSAFGSRRGVPFRFIGQENRLEAGRPCLPWRRERPSPEIAFTRHAGLIMAVQGVLEMSDDLRGALRPYNTA